jgi:flavin reductase (DIM6/NTAB) family NADH-FMN oxidoreductase RutF
MDVLTNPAVLTDTEIIRQRRLFRDAMGRFATGITIVTTGDRDVVHGMTANGFMSVSLEPQLVLISVRNVSRMLETILDNGSYGVSVLAAGQRRLSDHFAGRSVDGDVPFVQIQGVPVVADALAQVTTGVVDFHAAGDHTLVVGEVTSFELRSGWPLIFYGGTYRDLNDQHEWSSTWTNTELHWH